MHLNQALGEALSEIRKSKGLTQEDFSEVSSRTYISSLERGLKSPTVEKIVLIAERLEVHPLTMLALCFVKLEGRKKPDTLFELMLAELGALTGTTRGKRATKPARGRAR